MIANALKRLLTEAERANETWLKEAGRGLIDVSVIEEARAASTQDPTPQPAQATQPAEVTDAAIDAAMSHLYHNGKPTSKEYRVSIARAILALRPAAVPMTDEQHPLMVFAIEAEMGAYQENEIPLAARKAIKAAKTYGITTQAKKEGV